MPTSTAAPTLTRVQPKHYRVTGDDGDVLGDVFWFAGGRCWQWIVPRLPQLGDNGFTPTAYGRHDTRRDAIDALVEHHRAAAAPPDDGEFAREEYPGQLAETLADLVGRLLALGVFDSDNAHVAALAPQAERLVASVDPLATEVERCETCAAPMTVESWDIPVAYCPAGCD